MPAPSDDSAALEVKRYARLHELFSLLRELPAEQQESFLNEHCGEDESLREELLELLEATQEEGAEFLSEGKLEEARGQLRALLYGEGEDPAWIPERVGPYRVLRRIAEGGMGVIYEAQQAAPQRRVALKVIHPMLVTPIRLRRFRQETEILGRLKHPGIAQIYEAGTYDLGRGEQPYIAMEFVEGESVQAYAERCQLPLRGRLKLLAQIGDAVAHANDMGVIHRDLKPDNILVDEHGMPKVLDFGIARASEGSTMLTTMVTEQGDLLGTIAYMAPEQLEGDPERITVRADVYGLGAVAFELLSGRPPFDLIGLPLTAALQFALDKEPSRLGELRPELRGEVETIVGKALEKEPERRYASASAFSADLRAFLEHRPIQARPPGRAYRAAKFVRRHRALVGGTLATLLVMAIGLFASMNFAQKARVNARNMEAERARVVGVLLQNTQEALDRGEYWSAMDTFEEIGSYSAGWPFEFMDKVFPPMVDRESVKRLLLWVDDDHLAPFLPAPSPEREPFLIDGRTGEILEGRDGPLRSLGTDSFALKYADPALRIEADLQGEYVELLRDGEEPVRVYDRFLTEGNTTYLLKIPDRPRAIKMRSNLGELRVYDTNTGDLLASREGLRKSSCARMWVRGDGEVLYVWDSSLHLMQLETDTLEVVRRYSSIVTTNCDGGDVSLDGRLFAHAPAARPLEIWDLETETLLSSQQLGLLRGGSHRVRISPNSTKLYVAGDDRRGILLEFEEELVDPASLGTKQDPRAVTFEGHAGPIYGMALSPDGWLAASTCVAESVARVWDLATGEEIATLPKIRNGQLDPTNQGEWLAFSRDGSLLVGSARTGQSSTSRIVWNLLSGERQVTDASSSESHLSYLPCLDSVLEALGPDPPQRIGRKAVVPKGGPALAVQGIPARTTATGTGWELFSETNDETAIALSPGEGRVAIATVREVRIYDRTGREALASFPGHTYAVAWSPDGKWLAAGGQSGRIRLTDTERWSEVLHYPAHTSYVFGLAWTPDGTRLVSVSGDQTARVWDVRSKEAREQDRSRYIELLDRYRARSEAELLAEFERAKDAAVRGAIVRVLLERRR